MKSIFIVLAGLFISFSGIAQTKRIAQRSHSGSSKNLIADSEDNFGISPEIMRKSREAQAKKTAPMHRQQKILLKKLRPRKQ